MLSSRLAQMLQKLGHKGAVALVTGGAVGVCAVVGLGLIIAGVLMALALWIGAIWACLLLGAVFIGVAALMIGQKPRQTAPPTPPLEEIIFTLGFVAARALFQKRPGE